MTAPLRRELKITALLRSLTEAGIEFLVFGAVAGALHGYLRATWDLDIILESSSDNVDRMIAWLSANGARLSTNENVRFAIRHGRSMHRGANASVLTDLGEMDVVQRLPGLPEWPELRERAEEIVVEGMTILVMDCQTLIERKRLRGSPQDLVDVAALEALDQASSA